LYTLFHHLPLNRILSEQAPALLVAWICAELFYRFHSFTLECAAFLATWFAVDLSIQWLRQVFAKHSAH